MSIQQVSNNRPSGSASKSCDAGIPIAGRTSTTGVYEILKVNADGSLPTGLVPVSTSYLYLPDAQPLAPVGAFGAGFILAYNNALTGGFSVNITEAGVYKVIPFFMFEYAVLGACSFYLIERNTPLDFYTNGRIVGTDDWAPSVTDFAAGLALAIDNVANQQLGNSTVAKSKFAPNAQVPEVYLKVADYKLLIVCHTTLTTTGGAIYQGFDQFTKLS